MLELDQKYRGLMHEVGQNKQLQDSLIQLYAISKEHLPEYLWALQSAIDSTNLVRIEKIIAQHGYPGKTLAGSPANEAAFYILQHSDKIKQYIPYVETAAKNGELPFRLYAMMQDRLLMSEGKPQIWGTQARGFRTVNAASGQEEWVMFIWPIADPLAVNTLRKEAGFDSTVEENAKRLGVEYKVLSLEDVKKLQGE